MNSILATLTALAVSTSLATSVLADQASLLHSKKIIDASPSQASRSMQNKSQP